MFEFLRKKDNSVDSLVQEFKELTSKKAELEGKAKNNRLADMAAGLSTEKIAEKIHLVEIEIKLHDDAISAIRERIVDAVVAGRNAEFAELQKKEAELEKAYMGNLEKSGEMIGEILNLLEATGNAGFVGLANAFADTYATLVKTAGQRDQEALDVFALGLRRGRGIKPPSFQNFKAEKRKLKHLKTWDPKNIGECRRKAQNVMLKLCGDRDEREANANHFPHGLFGQNPNPHIFRIGDA
ncbi:hypothetical protein C6A37_01385 [Desulfobacteraceae bacterium SEEP-SAG9]|nr:hypothetical protein C6A37_01385 [Desulfobacteraceae bacterium SEEP-SAG9]